MNDNSDIDEAGLARLIPIFYDRVRADAELGPLFNAAVNDWAEHLERLTAFWSSVMLTTGRYKGSPMAAHLKHKAHITPALFDRWLALWSEVTDEVMPSAAAAALRLRRRVSPKACSLRSSSVSTIPSATRSAGRPEAVRRPGGTGLFLVQSGGRLPQVILAQRQFLVTARRRSSSGGPDQSPYPWDFSCHSCRFSRSDAKAACAFHRIAIGIIAPQCDVRCPDFDHGSPPGQIPFGVAAPIL